MARKKNATFQGSRMPDVARDALILERWLENAAGDFALTFDKITGANGHSSSDTINHISGARGCPLHLPLASQRINRSTALLTGSTSEDYYILAVPIFIPTGQQQQYILEVDTPTICFAEVRSASWALNFGPTPMGNATDLGTAQNSFRIALTLGTGWQYLLVKRRLYVGDQTLDIFGGWRLYPDYSSAGESNGLAPPTATAAGSPYPAIATLTPATALANDIDAEMVDEGVGSFARPLDAYVLTRINRMIGTLWEYLTGGKVPGNSAYTTTTTRDLNQANFTAEPEIDFPITTVSLGATLEAPTSKNWLGTYAAPTTGPTDHLRLVLTQNSGVTALVSFLRAWMPPFRTTGTRNLRLELLLCRYGAGDNLADWRASVAEASAGSSAEVALAQIGTTDFWRATVTNIPFTAAAANYFQIGLRCVTTASPINLEVVVLGYSLAFDP